MTGTNGTIGALITAATAGYYEGIKADTLWLMLCGFLVFFMQCGFALLEAGTVQAKNTKNILLKNLLDACLGAIIWYVIGYAVAVRRPPARRARGARARLLLRPRARARVPGDAPLLNEPPSIRPS